MIIIDKGTGLEYQVLGRESGATHSISESGIANGIGEIGWPLRLIRSRHTFGGVVYEEAGTRLARAGDYSLFSDYALIYWHSDDRGLAHSTILKPVGLEK